MMAKKRKTTKDVLQEISAELDEYAKEHRARGEHGEAAAILGCVLVINERIKELS
jgi:hypothetical protein